MTSLIKLDIDKKYANCGLVRLCDRICATMQLLHIDLKHVAWRKTKNGSHLYLTVRQKLRDREICAIQAIMGSDWRREAHNIYRLRNNIVGWNALYAQKLYYPFTNSRKRSNKPIEGFETQAPHYSRLLIRQLEKAYLKALNRNGNHEIRVLNRKRVDRIVAKITHE